MNRLHIPPITFAVNYEQPDELVLETPTGNFTIGYLYHRVIELEQFLESLKNGESVILPLDNLEPIRYHDVSDDTNTDGVLDDGSTFFQPPDYRQ